MLFESVLKKFQKGNFLGPPFTLTSYMGETREIRLFSGKGMEGKKFKISQTAKDDTVLTKTSVA